MSRSQLSRRQLQVRRQQQAQRPHRRQPQSPPPRDPRKRRRAARPTSTKPRAKREPKPEVEAEPLYLRLERKETRLRSDQIIDLTAHARRLNRAKGPVGERITENTLIRVAVDLLLAQADRLAGGDESELRNFVTLEVGASR
jgi:hypothetical protein